MRTGRSKTSCEANKIGLAMKTGRSKTSCEAMRGFAMKTKHSIRLNMRGFAMILRQARDDYFKCGLPQSGQAPSASSGQALIIMLLVMAAAITLGLAASRQVTTDIRVSTQLQESAKAYSAAEAGIERALSEGEVGAQFEIDTNVTASVEKITLGETNRVIWPHVVNPGEGVIFWLQGHKSDGSLDPTVRYTGNVKIYFNKSSGDTEPAIVAALYYDDGSSVRYYAYDAVNRGNEFDLAAGGSYSLTDSKQSLSKDFSHSVTISAGVTNPVFLWVRAVYADSWIGFESSTGNFPAQGYLYTSTGQVAPAEAPSVVSRKIQALTTFDQPPQVLLEPLTTLGDLVVTGN